MCALNMRIVGPDSGSASSMKLPLASVAEVDMLGVVVSSSTYRSESYIGRYLKCKVLASWRAVDERIM